MMMWVKRVAVLVFAVGMVLAGIVAYVQLRDIDKLYANAEKIDPAPIAVVLGASVQNDGQPSDALRDRLLVAQSVYERKLVPKILVTGDDGQYHIDETKIMRSFLEARGVPPQDIIEDGHGYRTYESCKRAVQVFGIKRAIVITQRFHIGRALYLCNRMGMDARGIASDLTSYRRIAYFTLRDIAASIEAWWDVNIRAPEPPVAYSE